MVNVLLSLKLMETENLEEILACMEDSDRHINESAKNRLIIRIKNELVRRGLKQYAINTQEGFS